MTRLLISTKETLPSTKDHVNIHVGLNNNICKLILEKAKAYCLTSNEYVPTMARA